MLISLVGQLLFGIPLQLSREIIDGICAEANRELLVTEESIKQKLQQVQLSLQEGEMSEAEFQELEDALIERLRMVREANKASGG